MPLSFMCSLEAHFQKNGGRLKACLKILQSSLDFYSCFIPIFRIKRMVYKGAKRLRSCVSLCCSPLHVSKEWWTTEGMSNFLTV